MKKEQYLVYTLRASFKVHSLVLPTSFMVDYVVVLDVSCVELLATAAQPRAIFPQCRNSTKLRTDAVFRSRPLV